MIGRLAFDLALAVVVGVGVALPAAWLFPANAGVATVIGYGFVDVVLITAVAIYFRRHPA